jgi:hypothetical protein
VRLPFEHIGDQIGLFRHTCIIVDGGQWSVDGG